MQTEREREVGELREMKVSIYQQSSVYSVNCSGSSEVTLKEKDNYRFAKKHTNPPCLRHQSAAVLSDCSKPGGWTLTWAAASALLWSSSVSARWSWAAFRSWWWIWTSKSDKSEPRSHSHLWQERKNISVQTYRRKKSKKCPESFSPGRPVAARECHDGLSSVVYFPLLG